MNNVGLGRKILGVLVALFVFGLTLAVSVFLIVLGACTLDPVLNKGSSGIILLMLFCVGGLWLSGFLASRAYRLCVGKSEPGKKSGR